MYRIYPDHSKRKPDRPTNIIVMHAPNLIDSKIHIDNRVRLSTFKFTWGIWQKYLHRFIEKRRLPMHYFMELVDKDYVVYKGLSNYKPSYFLEDMVEKGIIDRQYRNSIVVVVEGDYSKEIPETRMFEHLSDKVLVPLMKEWRLRWDDIMFYDECLTQTYDKAMEKEDFRFEFKPMTKWNPIILKIYLDKYNTYH